MDAETQTADAARDLTEWDLNLDAPDPIIAEGRYAATVETAETKYSAGGNPMLIVKYRLVEEGEFYNWTIRQNFMLSGEQTWRLKNFLKSIGYSGFFRVNEDCSALEGQPVWVDVRHGPGFPDKSTTQAQVSYVFGRDTDAAVDPPF